MKITNVQLQISFIVETDDDEFNVYRRDSSNNWDNLMGASWEYVFDEKRIQELENLFNQWPKTANYD